MNILGYDPIWKDRAAARFKEEHFRLIREGGFSSVRINLHPFSYMDPENGYKINPEWLEVMEWAVDNALENDLMVILDLHEHRKMGREYDQYEPYFLPFWEQIAGRYHGWPPEVLFELLGEPGNSITPEIWNGLLKEIIPVIRQTNPERTLIIGPAFWSQRFEYLDSLALPEDDRNIIATIHYYEPFRFTHQSAPWMASTRDTSGVLWNSLPEERDAINEDFNVVHEWSEKNNRPVYLGEFGAYDSADIQSRVLWYDFVSRTAEQMGFSWTVWQFDSDFIVYDIDNNQWNVPIIRALIPE